MLQRAARLRLIPQTASPEEAAAIIAAIERFARATAPHGAGRGAPPDPWRRAAILEGVGSEGQSELTDPWINT